MKRVKKFFCMILTVLIMLTASYFNIGNEPVNTVSASSNNVFYIDPINGDINNDGSFDKPWSTLQEVVESKLIETMQPKSYPYDGTGSLVIKNEGAPIKSGDTIILMNGYHGEFSALRAYNSDYITIQALEGHAPKLSGVSITAGSKWHLKGLTISQQFAEQYERRSLISITMHGYSGPSYDIIVEGCKGYSVQDTSKWTAADWDTKSCSGVSSSGRNIRIENNYLKNVNFGISVSGNNSIIRNNTIENFAGDGLRGIADDLLFEGNVVKNCYDVNGNHDDGFQSWAVKGDPPERVTLRGNLFINYEDPNQPLVGTLQGIGLFDGPYIDWVIENNIVAVDHWHGISMYGGVNSKIVNNTVVDLNSVRPGPPWIRVSPTKAGEPSKNCIVRNNIAPSFQLQEGITSDHNYKVTDYNELFVDYEGLDLHLKAGTPVIDAGSTELAPVKDFDQKARPFGKGVDIGAYEYDYGGFSDVYPGHWAYEAVMAMAGKGIISGYPDKSFKPDKPVARAEFAKIMVAALQLEQEEQGKVSFKDVGSNHWAYKFIESAKPYLAGYITVNGDYYYPEEAAAREDMAAALVKALHYNDETPDYSLLEQYSDKGEISEELRVYIAIAIGHGLIKGYPTGTDGVFTFSPKRTLTRAEAAMLIFNAASKGEKRISAD